MRRIALWAVALTLAGAAPARAGEVFHAGLGTTLGELVAGADGGAWIFIDRPGTTEAIGRARPDGSFRTAATRSYNVTGTLGPDGTAWYHVDFDRFLRSDADGALSTVTRGEAADLEDDGAFATGADGTLWTPARRHVGLWHIASDGTATKALGGLPKPCDRGMIVRDMARASDGAMWLTDQLCERLIRIGPSGTSTIALPFEPGDLAADANGGAWATGGAFANRIAHVDAAGAVTAVRLPDDVYDIRDTAVAPDGSAWLTFGTCTLMRITAAGDVTSLPAPAPATELAFDPAGGMWLASAARLLHLAPGESAPGACDDRAPRVRLNPARDVASRRLRDLTFTATVREPVRLALWAHYYNDADGNLTVRTIHVNVRR